MTMIEILTLTLKPGTRDRFRQIYATQALPLLKKWNFQVIAHGLSLHDHNSYYVIRLFGSLEDRQRAEDAFYGSENWRKGPRETILALIEHDSYIVVPVEALKDWLGISPFTSVTEAIGEFSMIL
jgi:hypothetical protein